MALRFANLDRPSIRRLKPGERITEHGITAESLRDGDLRFSVNVMVDGKRIHRVVGKAGDGVTRTQCEDFIEKVRANRQHPNTGITHRLSKGSRHQRPRLGGKNRNYRVLGPGGRKRNRTAVRGFAVLCIATLPSGRLVAAYRRVPHHRLLPDPRTPIATHNLPRPPSLSNGHPAGSL